MRESNNPTMDIDEFYNDVRNNAYKRDIETGEWDLDLDYISEKEEAFRENLERLNSIGVVYSKTDRILTGDNVLVEVKDLPELDTVSANDGRTIVFNAHLIEDINEDTITSLHGFNYHEVAHILYTPREGSELGQFIKEKGYRRAFNILEDARIERLLTAKYPSTSLFLEASFLEYILKGDVEEWKDAFILSTGRLHLDLEVRQEIANRFTQAYGIAIADKVHSIIHNYRELVMPSDYAKAKELITRFAEIVGDDEQNPPPFIPKDGKGHSEREQMSKGRMEGKKEQQAQQDKATKQGQGYEPENLDNPQAQQEPDSNSPTTDAQRDPELDNAMKEKIAKMLADIKREESVQQDTKAITKAINNNSIMRSGVKKASYTNQTIKASVMATSKAFATQLERLRTDNDPKWETEQSSGRLNIGRAMNFDHNSINTLFDQWSEGNDSNDIEAVILLDTSGSMYSQVTQTMESAWIIKRGVERINGRVSVYKYNHDSRLVYGADEKAKPTEYRYVQSSGSTNPYKALIEAERILTASRKSIKILFTVTDGEWDNESMCNEVIKRLNNNGVMTSVVYLGRLEAWKSDDPSQQSEYDEQHKKRLISYRHGAKLFRTVTEPRDLVAVASDIVKDRMGRRR
jgi:hypothetical protein